MIRGGLMLVLWGKRKKLAKVTRIEDGAVYQIEMPPDSGIFYMPLVVDGKNVEEYTEVSDDSDRRKAEESQGKYSQIAIEST
jgi:hypothetical protein